MYPYGKRLSRIMELRGLKQMTLAKGATVSQATISRILNGEIAPNLKTLQKIAQTLNVPLEVFTHQNDTVAEILFELHHMKEEEIRAILDYIRKEKLWKAKYGDSPQSI